MLAANAHSSAGQLGGKIWTEVQTRLPLDATKTDPQALASHEPVRRAVNGNPTVVDFGRLPWAIIIGANSSLELRDLIIHSYAPRSSASNTSHYYVGGLVSWPSISMAPYGVLKRCGAPAAHLPALRVCGSASQRHPWRSLPGSVRRAQSVETPIAQPCFMLAGSACHALTGSGRHPLEKASALHTSSTHLPPCCRYNTTQYFWSSTRYTRGDCQWRLAAALPGEEDFVSPTSPRLWSCCARPCCKS